MPDFRHRIPFSGALDTILTDEDFVEFAEALERLNPTGEATLGGDRATELHLIVGHQDGGTPGALAMECSLTPSGDDLYPCLRWLIFDLSPFAARAAANLRTLAATHPWPTP